MYLRFVLSCQEFEQEAALIVLQAQKEHDPAKGKLTTCIAKVARRRNMQLLRASRNQERNQYAEREYTLQRTKWANQ
jgi:hypothetical protein